LREAQERLHSAMHQLDALTVLHPDAIALARHALNIGLVALEELGDLGDVKPDVRHD